MCIRDSINAEYGTRRKPRKKTKSWPTSEKWWEPNFTARPKTEILSQNNILYDDLFSLWYKLLFSLTISEIKQITINQACLSSIFQFRQEKEISFQSHVGVKFPSQGRRSHHTQFEKSEGTEVSVIDIFIVLMS
eukprot:TRINITY_DN4169_c0_g1_i1.p1 TRINITY_DN4169_c0_g1~~TRINITY_DN4169_c0_g1_i1.p1  ORF type:complete len:134 (+),score=33.97 TRINITY_DN4169_c0_g1_i1:38-439(+)